MKVRTCHKCGVLFSPEILRSYSKMEDIAPPSSTVCPLCGFQSILADEFELEVKAAT